MGAGKQVSILFEGVYMNSHVWVNGNYVGNRPYGYSTFEYDITPYLYRDFTANNIVAVRVENLGVNSRWYAGSGIYRHVWLSVRDSISIPTWGLQVATPEINLVAPQKATSAVVALNVTIVNKLKASGSVTPVHVKVEIRGKGINTGEIPPVLATVTGAIDVSLGDNATITLEVLTLTRTLTLILIGRQYHHHVGGAFGLRRFVPYHAIYDDIHYLNWYAYTGQSSGSKSNALVDQNPASLHGNRFHMC